ncbi:Ig-like domain-containing protein [candidate division KSB1 bacterium]
MKKLVTILAFTFLLSSFVYAQETIVLESINITPRDTTVIIGDEIQFTAVVTDTSDAVVDTAVSWSVEGGIGTITEDGEFTAETAGEGYIFAEIGDFADSVIVTVNTEEDAGDVEFVISSIEIKPSNAELEVGETLKFKAEVIDTSGQEVEVDVTWFVVDTLIGTIDNKGNFTAVAVGETKVSVSYEEFSDTAAVTVTSDTSSSSGELNTIDFIRVLPNGNETQFGSTISEGGTRTLGGMPSPLNILNGGKLTFPENSISENITITIRLPEFANTSGQEATFGDSIVMAVTFEVSVNDSVISPFYFDTPIELSLPYKRGLMSNLGIEPEDLSMFFVTNSGSLDSAGITDVAVDTANNKITGLIVHFSTIAVAPKPSQPGDVTSIGDSEPASKPESFTLDQNYPNPFNPETTISFDVPRSSFVSLKIYSILGQEVKTLVSGHKAVGKNTVKWDGTNNNGIKVNSGIYIYRLNAEGVTFTRKMVLVK